MGSQNAEEKKRTEKIENYRLIIDSAYVLFDGKYSMHEIETMPYKQLLYKIEREQEIIDKFKSNNSTTLKSGRERLR